MQFEMMIPCLFGVEAFLSRELKSIGIEVTSTEDGRVCFNGGYEEMAKANIWVRTGERVLIKAAEFYADNFDALYDGVRNAPWGEFLPQDAKLSISGHCLKSKLSSSPRCRAIIKKAIADSVGAKYGITHLPETGTEYQIRFSLLKDRVTVSIDTSGESLHMRGYRQLSNAAPLRETLAAAIVYLSRWRYENSLADLFCGSGTIPIEAAMIKRNIAPGINRSFAFEQFEFVPDGLADRIKSEAKALIKDVPLDITAMDINPEYVELTKANAEKAGVGDCIKVVLGNALDFKSSLSGGTIISNPPYGERLSDKEECSMLYKEFGKTYSALDNWAAYILAASDEFESDFGKKADKTRKLYNGMIQCRVYQYFSKR
ncbi:MAG: class I SAM-dependent RNA methyltransferase [Eubacteriales bacterium]|nr:class I SAM-dependent RNA methyltransferase [Eubacteriales bacterium]